MSKFETTISTDVSFPSRKVKSTLAREEKVSGKVKTIQELSLTEIWAKVLYYPFTVKEQKELFARGDVSVGVLISIKNLDAFVQKKLWDESDDDEKHLILDKLNISDEIQNLVLTEHKKVMFKISRGFLGDEDYYGHVVSLSNNNGVSLKTQEEIFAFNDPNFDRNLSEWVTDTLILDKIIKRYADNNSFHGVLNILKTRKDLPLQSVEQLIALGFENLMEDLTFNGEKLTDVNLPVKYFVHGNVPYFEKVLKEQNVNLETALTLSSNLDVSFKDFIEVCQTLGPEKI